MKKILLLFSVICFITQFLFAQGPNAPEAGSFEPIDNTDLVNLFTGDFSYNIPMLNVPSPEGGFPVNLSYHAGIAMDQEASWVGLGWNINPGVINRSVNGFPDDWGRVTYNELFYDRGETYSHYTFSIGGTLPNGITLGVSSSWGDNRSFGGVIGYGGLSLSISSESFSVGVGIAGGGAGVGLNLTSNSQGVSLGFNQSVGVGGLSLSQSITYNFSDRTSTSVLTGGAKLDGIGVSLRSNDEGGATLSSSFSATSKVGSSNQSDYYVHDKSGSGGLDLGFFWAKYGYQEYEYSLFKKTSYTVSGILYPYESMELENNLVVKTDHLMDVREFRTGKRRSTDNTSDKLTGFQFTVPNYDGYSVNAQGLSGVMSPKFYEEVQLWGKSIDYQYEHDLDTSNREGLEIDQTQFLIDNNINLSNYKLNEKLFFDFDNSNNSFLRIQTGDVDGSNSSNYNDLSEAFNYTTLTDNTYSSNTTDEGYQKKNGNRIRSGKFVETLTNEQIVLQQAGQNFIEAKGIDRLHDTTGAFPAKGIGAFKVTTADGKTYHYSLPVYQYESFYKDFKELSEIEDRFYESRKTKPYATHWLLTGITGPDYIDLNNNGELDEQDYGYWIELEYGKWSDGYGWRSPKTDYKELGGGKNFFWGRKQIYYLDLIRTRSHTAYFVKNLRLDNKGSDIEIYDDFVGGGAFNIDLDSKLYDDRELLQIPDPQQSSFYKSDGSSYNFSSSFRLGKKRASNYVDIPTNFTLMLEKIILVQNEDAELNKAAGSLTNIVNGACHYNNGWKDIVKNAIGQPLGFNLYESPPSLVRFSSHFDENVLDVSDFNYETFKEKALKVIDFEHDYSLARDSPNSSASTGGRLSLRAINFLGKRANSSLPPYAFNYHGSSTSYYKDDQDNWGYHWSTPETWSLKDIINPNGGKTTITYESDSYISEALFPKNLFQIPPSSLKSLRRGYSNALSVEFSDFLGYDGVGPKIGSEFLLRGLVDEYGPSYYVFSFTPSSGPGIHNKIGLTLKQNCDDTFHQSLPIVQTVPLDSNTNTIYLVGAEPEDAPQNGGGIRVLEIQSFDGNYNSTSTSYDYINPQNGLISGTTTYAPRDSAMNYKFLSEIPAPQVNYEHVSVTQKDINTISGTKASYHFDVLGFSYTMGDNVLTFGNEFKVKGGLDNTEKGKFTIYDKTVNAGRLLSVSTFNIEDELISERSYNYQKDLETNGEGGVKQESFIVRKYHKFRWPDLPGSPVTRDFDGYSIGSLSLVKYPNITSDVTVTTNNSVNTSFSGKRDFLTGQPLISTSISSDGTKFKSEVVPAYKIPQYNSSSGHSMGSKVDNITNRNMLTQEAASFSYMIDGSGNEKLMGANITTWNNNWDYFDYDGSDETPSSDPKRKIWRKHRNYTWKGSLNTDGSYNGYSGDYDGFNWNVGVNQSSGSQWQMVGETSYYDHYSMPVENKDINGNYASTKMDRNDEKVFSVSNSSYNEQFYSGAEDDEKNGYYGGGVRHYNPTFKTSHTGDRAESATTSSKTFRVVPRAKFQPGQTSKKFKVSVWVSIGDESKARIKTPESGSLQTFSTQERVYAGKWVQLNHYFDITTITNNQEVYVRSSSGTIYFDDFRLHPVQSTMTSYVYNDWDELTYVLGGNNMGTRYEYDDAGRLKRTYVEVANASGLTGGFKKSAEFNQNYKRAISTGNDTNNELAVYFDFINENETFERSTATLFGPVGSNVRLSLAVNGANPNMSGLVTGYDSIDNGFYLVQIPSSGQKELTVRFDPSNTNSCNDCGGFAVLNIEDVDLGIVTPNGDGTATSFTDRDLEHCCNYNVTPSCSACVPPPPPEVSINFLTINSQYLSNGNRSYTANASGVSGGTPGYTFKWFRKIGSGSETYLGSSGSTPSYTFNSTTCNGSFTIRCEVRDSETPAGFDDRTSGPYPFNCTSNEN